MQKEFKRIPVKIFDCIREQLMSIQDHPNDRAGGKEEADLRGLARAIERCGDLDLLAAGPPTKRNKS